MRFITLNEQNKVVGVRDGKEIVEGEIESDIGQIGQIMQQDGTFISPEITTQIVESQLDRMENTLDVLLLKQEGII